MASPAPGRLGVIARRAADHVRVRLRARAFRTELQPAATPDLEEIGDLSYGGYLLPTDALSSSSVCYLAGTGTDITFDLLLIARFGCQIHAFDPVPAAARYVEVAARYEPRLTFHPMALWRADEELQFHAPREAGFVSHSAVNLHDTPVAFSAAGRSVRSLMHELDHERVDLLKISAEGSEHAIVEGTLADGVRPRVVCIEFAQPGPVADVHTTMRRLVHGGYELVGASVRPWNWKLTWLRTDGAAPRPRRG
ncbi:MAG: FkbM family methyltransferase [Solirubrobacteraceae bacterium]